MPPPPAALESTKSLQDYAEGALTTSAFTEHTSITLEDDPVQVPIAYTPFTGLLEPSTRPLPKRHFSPIIKPRLSETLRRRIFSGSLTSGNPANGPPGLSDMAHYTPTSLRTIATSLAIPGFHRRAHSDSRTATNRTISTAPPCPCATL